MNELQLQHLQDQAGIERQLRVRANMRFIVHACVIQLPY